MLANKNNHLIKKFFKKGGNTMNQQTYSLNQRSDDPQMQSTSSDDDPQMQSTSEIKSSDDDPQMLNPEIQYPDQKYLYKNISSQKQMDTIKTYVCAFNNSNFVKYIVDTKGLFPSFTFSMSTTQKGGFLDDDSSSDDLDTLFQKNVIDFVKTFYNNQRGGRDRSESLNQSENPLSSDTSNQSENPLSSYTSN